MCQRHPSSPRGAIGQRVCPCRWSRDCSFVSHLGHNPMGVAFRFVSTCTRCGETRPRGRPKPFNLFQGRRRETNNGVPFSRTLLRSRSWLARFSTTKQDITLGTEKRGTLRWRIAANKKHPHPPHLTKWCAHNLSPFASTPFRANRTWSRSQHDCVSDGSLR